MSAAILVIAHGSRLASANADLVELARLVQARTREPVVEIAYLELAAPDIPAGLQRCVDRGASSIRMLPYFLSAGAHVTEDLQRFRREFRQQHPEIDCRVCPPLGLHPRVVDALVDRLAQVVEPE